MSEPKGLRVSLNLGANFSDPPSELKRGELSIARNSFYIPESSQLEKVRGRSLFGTVGTAINGSGWCRFRNGNSFLIVGAGANYYSAPVGTTGVFTSRASSLIKGGSTEVVYDQITNRAYLLDGVNPIRVWDGAAASMRLAGLNKPLAGTVTFLNNSASSYSSTVTFSYCHTEVDDTTDTDNPIQSPPSDPVTMAASAISGTFKYAFPAVKNAATTKRRIWRTQNGGAIFYLLAEVGVSVLRYYDGDDTEGLGSGEDNGIQWGFTTVDDSLLSRQDYMPATGSPQTGTYINDNGALPYGSIGGMFQNTFFVAGVPGFPTHLYYSLTGQPECTSPTNVIQIASGHGDPIRATGRASDRLIIFTTNSIHRLNSFPQPIDPGFGLQSSALEEVTNDHGCVSKRAVVNFGVGQPNNRLFYVSERGPFMTDAYETFPLNRDLDWSERWLNKGMLNQCIARNYAKYQQIWLFLASPGSTSLDMALIYHYHPDHIKEAPVGKWTGPVHVRASSVTTLNQENTEGRMYVSDTDINGSVYLEDEGLIDGQHYDDPDGKILWEWMTGDDCLGEESENKRRQRVYLNMVGTETFGGELKYALNKADKESLIHLTPITKAKASTVKAGTASVSALKTVSYRGGVWRTASHDRWHLKELATGPRAAANLEVEIEPFGRQK